MMNTKSFVWESVTNAWKYGREFVDKQAWDWNTAGYAVTVFLQNNKYLGAPQNRPRMFFIAHKYPLVFPDLVYDTPKVGELLKTHAKELVDKGQPFKYPGYEMLWELSTKKKNYANFNSLYHTALTAAEKAQIKTIPGFTVKSLHPDRHALVLNDRVVHPYEPRFLSLRELELLSGIPYSWKFQNKYGPAALEMSRTVLPPVGKYIATAVKDGFEMEKTTPYYRVVDTRKGEWHEEALG